MADRPNHLQGGYPMTQPNMMNLVQQQQQQQQQQASMAYQQPQPAMNATQQIPGVTNPDHQRMWQQIQDRHRAMGGADGMGQQQISPQQMSDFLRNQPSLVQGQSHQQQQQHPPQLQQAQQFASLGGMNNALPGQNPLIAMQRQQGMQNGGVGGISNAQVTPQMAQLLAQQRSNATNPAMIQMNRQLGLLNRAQKQQPQNGPTNFGMPGPSFTGQQNLGQLPFQTGMFPPKPDEGHIPVPQGQQQFQVHNGAPNASVPGRAFPTDVLHQVLRSNDGRPLSIDEVRFKTQQLRLIIHAEKQSLANAPKNAATEFMIKKKEAEIQHKEQVLSRLVEYVATASTQQGGAQLQQPAPPNSADSHGGSELNSMGFPNTSQQQAGQQSMQANQNWPPQMTNTNLPNQLASNGGSQPMLNGTVQNGQSHAPQRQINSPFHPSLVQSQQQQRQTPVPRSNPTPQQMLQAFMPGNSHSSPPSSGSATLVGQGNLGPQAPPLEGQEGQRPNGLAPLSRERFMQLLREWWRHSGINPNSQMVSIGNRQIDLYLLHTEVLQYGGVLNVRRHDLWNVIAAKMGWTPASISESGRTPSEIAEQFKSVYEQLLESFEQTYMAIAMKRSLTVPQQQTAGQQVGPNQAGVGLNQVPRQLSTQQMLHMIKLAHVSVDQLRALRYPENLIQQIEQNRTALQAAQNRMASQQQQQQQRLQQAGMNGTVPFQNQPQAPPNTLNSASLHPQGNGISGANALVHPGGSAGSSHASDLPVQQRPQQMQMSSQNAQLLLSNIRRPTMEMNKHALEKVEQLKLAISRERVIRPEHVKQLSDAEKATLPDMFEATFNVIKQICGHLHIYLAATNDFNTVRGVLGMLDMCDKHRQLIQATPPVYVLDIATLQNLMKVCNDVKVRVFAVLRRVQEMNAQSEENATMQSDTGLPPPVAIQQGPLLQNIAPSPSSIPPRSSTTQPQPHVPQQTLRPPPGRTPQMSPARPPSVAQNKKGQSATSPNVTENVPSPSASTPLPSGTTPSHLQTSPVTPKSPKPKTQTKPRAPRQRRASVKVQQQQSSGSTVGPAPSASSSTVGGAPASTIAEPTTGPVHAAPSPKGTSLKRPRDEDVSNRPTASVQPDQEGEETPSKRIKNDWQHVADAEPSKKQVEAENIKTSEDAAKFYSDMTQLLAMSNDAELPPEVHDTLTQLVKTVGNGLDIPDAGRNSSVPSLTNAGSSSPKVPDGDDFFSYLDFTAFQQDDDKVDTPDLVPTSSTNPSPESGAGSEVDHPSVPASSGTTGDRTKIVDSSESESRTDFFDTGSDSLRLGIWGEIDGGESGYFNSSDTWKWDTAPSSSGDTPWAIST